MEVAFHRVAFKEKIMPRTRQVTNKKLQPSPPPTETEKDLSRECQNILEKVAELKQQLLDKHAEKCALIISNNKNKLAKIPLSIRNKTLEELKINGEKSLNLSKSVNISTKTLNYSTHQRATTSDDGYSTSDSRGASVTASSSVRQSRQRKLRANSSTRCSPASKKTKRITRSLSRTTENKYKTPMNTKKIESFGMVTPKVKPNTPHVILRRPLQGEMAISLQGSPLMTTAMVQESTANINIPCADGRIINMQPIIGIRTSEIPELDPEIRLQLQALKANLEKIL